MTPRPTHVDFGTVSRLIGQRVGKNDDFLHETGTQWENKTRTRPLRESKQRRCSVDSLPSVGAWRRTKTTVCEIVERTAGSSNAYALM